MTVAHHILRAMVESWCTAAQLLAVIAADLDAVLEAAVGEALFPTAAEPIAGGPVESGLPMPKSGLATPPALARKERVRLVLRRYPALPPAAREVGEFLISYWDASTGRCDVGVGQIARLVGLTERSVRRAVSALVRAGLFGRILHGSRHSHTNLYVPQWPALEAAYADLAAPRSGEDADRFGGPITRTHPDSPGQAHPDSPGLRVRQSQSQNPTTSGGSGRHRTRDPDQLELRVHGVVAGTAAQRAAAAIAHGEASARQRLLAALHAHLARFGPRFAASSMAEIDEATWARALAVERDRRRGLDVLLGALGPKMPESGTGPPAASGIG